jgi:hypothetical protein
MIKPVGARTETDLTESVLVDIIGMIPFSVLNELIGNHVAVAEVVGLRADLIELSG